MGVKDDLNKAFAEINDELDPIPVSAKGHSSLVDSSQRLELIETIIDDIFLLLGIDKNDEDWQQKAVDLFKGYDDSLALILNVLSTKTGENMPILVNNLTKVKLLTVRLKTIIGAIAAPLPKPETVTSDNSGKKEGERTGLENPFELPIAQPEDIREGGKIIPLKG
jgi:hypothetical protein